MATAKLTTRATLDTRQFERGVKEIKAAANSMATDIAQKNREVVKQFVQLASPVAALVAGVRGVAGAFRAAADAGDEMAKAARAVGVTANTYATLKASAEAAGLSAEQFSDALEKIKSGAADVDNLTAAWSRNGDAVERVNALTRAQSQLRAASLREGAGNWLQRNITNPLAFAMSSISGDESEVQMRSILAARGGKVTAEQLGKIGAELSNSNPLERIFNAPVSVAEMTAKAEKMIAEYKSDLDNLRAESDRARLSKFVTAAGGDVERGYELYKAAIGRLNPNAGGLYNPALADKAPEILSRDKFEAAARPRFEEVDLAKAIADADKARDALKRQSVQAYPGFGINSYGGDVYGVNRYETIAGYMQAQRDSAAEQALEPVTKRIDDIAAILRGDIVNANTPTEGTSL